MILLIIDMQVGLFSQQTPRFDADGVVSRINSLVQQVRKKRGAVIFIQHDGTDEDGLKPGTAGREILPELDRRQTDIMVRKTACDAFYETNLQEILSGFNSKTLILCGCATDFCVDTTLRRAASKDFNVTIVADGHTTTDRPHLSAEKIIQHHNFIWGNLILPHNTIKVATAAEICSELKS